MSVVSGVEPSADFDFCELATALTGPPSCAAAATAATRTQHVAHSPLRERAAQMLDVQEHTPADPPWVVCCGPRWSRIPLPRGGEDVAGEADRVLSPRGRSHQGVFSAKGQYELGRLDV